MDDREKYLAQVELLSMFAAVQRSVNLASSASECNGICRLLEMTNEEFDSHHEAVLLELFQSWPEYSGNINYPVPSHDVENSGEVRAYRVAQENGTMWIGPYGKTRTRLLKYMLIELTTVIAKEEIKSK